MFKFNAKSSLIDMEELAVSVRKRELRPFEYFEIQPLPRPEKIKRQAKNLADKPFDMSGGGIPSLHAPIKWSDHPRSFEFHLHAFKPIKRLLIAHSVTDEDAHLDVLLAFANDWISQNCPKVNVNNLPKQIKSCLKDTHPSRWYDMAIGQRMQVLAYVLDAALRRENVSPKDYTSLRDQLVLHHALLEHPDVYKQHNNHGFYQAITHFAASTRLPELDEKGRYRDLSRSRLLAMIDKQFGADGAHTEHSPGYHYMLTVTLVNAVNSGLFDKDLAAKVAEYQDVLVDMIKPDGSIVTIGDTDPRDFVDDSTLESFFTNARLNQIIAGTPENEPTPLGVKTYPETGYVFARLMGANVNPKPQNASYLAQMAGFHSRTHKHADNLSFIWHDRGHDILIDPGRYAYEGKTTANSQLYNDGFWYSDENRVYVESTRAHNALQIDDKNHQRSKIKPFGSAIKFAKEIDGNSIAECFMVLNKTVSHRRVLIMVPDRALLVLDWAYDRNENHDFRQWFQFNTGWKIEREGGHLIATNTNQNDDTYQVVRMFSLGENTEIEAPVSKQKEPQLQGWMSDAANSMIEATSVSLLTRNQSVGRFLTLFVFGENSKVFTEKTRFNKSMRTGRVAWNDEQGSVVLSFNTDEAGSPQLKLEQL